MSTSYFSLTFFYDQPTTDRRITTIIVTDTHDKLISIYLLRLVALEKGIVYRILLNKTSCVATSSHLALHLPIYAAGAALHPQDDNGPRQ